MDSNLKWLVLGELIVISLVFVIRYIFNNYRKGYGFERKKGIEKGKKRKAITLEDWKERYEILKKYQTFLKAQRERK